MTDRERTDEETPEEPAQETPGAEEPRSGPEEPIDGPDLGAGPPPADTDVYDMLRAAIGLFVQEAWVALGLQPRYGSGDTQMDLRCARVAIDTTQMLIQQLGDEADAGEKRDFDRILTDLRVNFMRRSKRAEEEA
ncbi:MAG: DUF1844 domain-containing protein [Armatimonadota bacterium]|jgi:hypothetical protein